MKFLSVEHIVKVLSEKGLAIPKLYTLVIKSEQFSKTSVKIIIDLFIASNYSCKPFKNLGF